MEKRRLTEEEFGILAIQLSQELGEYFINSQVLGKNLFDSRDEGALMQFAIIRYLAGLCTAQLGNMDISQEEKIAREEEFIGITSRLLRQSILSCKR